MKSHKNKSEEKEVIYAFIDSQNLNLGVRSQGWELDFGRFRVYLKDKYNVTKAFLFIGYIPKNEKLYSFLNKFGYKLVFKPVVEYGSTKTIKGNVDAELVLHSMIEYPNYGKSVIISGDGDFHCLIEYLYEKRKLLKVIVPNKYKYSALLRKFADHLDFLNMQKLNLQKKERHNPQTRSLRVASHRDWDHNTKDYPRSQQKKTGIRGRSKP